MTAFCIAFTAIIDYYSATADLQAVKILSIL